MQPCSLMSNWRTWNLITNLPNWRSTLAHTCDHMLFIPQGGGQRWRMRKVKGMTMRRLTATHSSQLESSFDSRQIFLLICYYMTQADSRKLESNLTLTQVIKSDSSWVKRHPYSGGRGHVYSSSTWWWRHARKSSPERTKESLLH